MLLVFAWRVDIDHDPSIFYFNIDKTFGGTPNYRPRSFGQFAGKKLIEYLGAKQHGVTTSPPVCRPNDRCSVRSKGRDQRRYRP